MEHIKKFNEMNAENERNEYGKYIISELDKALKKFGTYQYHDKGSYDAGIKIHQ